MSERMRFLPHLLSQLRVGPDVVLQAPLSFSQHSQLLAEALHQLFLQDRRRTV